MMRLGGGRKYHLIWGTLAAAAIFVLAAYLPNAKKRETLRTDLSERLAQVDGRAARLLSIKTLHQDVVAGREKLTPFERAVPQNQDLGDFLESVDRLAVLAGVSDKNVIPAIAYESDNVNCLPLEIDFRGGFDAAYEFLKGVESLPRVARIQRLKMSPSEDVPGELITSLTVHVYYRSS